MDIQFDYEPRVYLVGRQCVDQKALDAFLFDENVEQWETDTDIGGQKIAETAGRVCYMSFAKPRPGGNGAYLGHILQVGHGSVLEHTVFNFIISGVSRSLSHELVRHRAGWGYSQLSQRFVDESHANFVVPPGLEEEVRIAEQYVAYKGGDMMQSYVHSLQDELDRPTRMGLLWLMTVRSSQEGYKSLSDYLAERDAAEFKDDKTLGRKRAREAARSVLPNATETKIFATANARALRHFLEMRGNIGADREIRALACELLTVLAAEAPALFGDYKEDESGSISTPYKKV